MKRPNILLITTDQQRWDHLGVAGLRGIATPNLDRLGREGVHFARAYTPSPVCTPARVSLLTGTYPSVHRAHTIGVTIDPFPRPTLPDLMGDAGYDTALFGKSHFCRKADEEAHLVTDGNLADDKLRSSKSNRENDGPYLGFRVARLADGHTTNGTPLMHYRAWLENHGLSADDWSAWFPDERGRHDHGQTGVWSIPMEYHYTTFVTELTEQWIREHAGSDQESGQAPWFCWASYQDPHEPFVCPEPWYSRVDSDRLPMLEDYREGELDDKPLFYREARAAGFAAHDVHGRDGTDWGSFDDGEGIPCAYRRDDLDGREREAMQATLGMVGSLDDAVGRLLGALEESGQLDNTVIIYSSDHGELHGHHGFWHKGLFAYEDVQRVPLLMWGPETVRAAGTVQALANLVDLAPTILGFAGLNPPVGMQGVDLAPVLSGKADSVREATIVELEATRNVYQQTLVTPQYKLVVYREFEEGELYDLDSDPDQYRNLWSSPDHAATRAGLLLELAREQMRGVGEPPERTAFA